MLRHWSGFAADWFLLAVPLALAPTIAVAQAETPAPAEAVETQVPLAEDSPLAPVVIANAAEMRIRQALSHPAGVDILFVDIPLKEGMAFLADAHKITIYIDEAALQASNVPSDHPINVTLSGITLRSALRIILEPLGLTYVIENEVLKITTVEQARGQMATRLYDLTVIGPYDGPFDRLIRMLVEPKSWDQEGGEGTAAVVGEILVVRQSHDVHEQVEQLLRQLQEANARPHSGGMEDLEEQQTAPALEEPPMPPREEPPMPSRETAPRSNF